MKRFYKVAAAEAAGRGWRVTLDGRAIKTVGGRAQVVPSQALAEAMAAEWADQGEEIDPALFVLRDMADYALDVVALDPATAVEDLLPYAETDTLCYRADPEEPLYPRQLTEWEPPLIAFEARHGLRFERVCGIMHKAQPAETLARLRELLAAHDAFILAALRSLATLPASLVIGLSALEAEADLDSLWAAASLEEEWQADLWGREAEAEARRARRKRDFLAAARFAALARGLRQ